MERSELQAWLRLTSAPGVGIASVRRLLASFGLPESIFEQSSAALRQVVSAGQAESLAVPPDSLDAQVHSTWDWLQHGRDSAPAGNGRAIVTLGDIRYPAALLAIEDPPPMLYLQGAPDWVGDPSGQRLALALRDCFAIVGSRNPTPQGASNARQFARALGQAGLTIVSGLALGIDAAAHEGALENADDKPDVLATVAVVGTGLDRVYPRKHLDLARRIARQGLIISEYPIGTPPIAANFPRRNRIISGLAQGTLVVEAALQSGSLITARLAAEQGKEVFAIPGSIHSPQSRGCHALIRQGAKLVESAQDVLEEFKWHSLARPALSSTDAGVDADTVTDATRGSDGSSALLQSMGFDPVSLDALQARTGLDTARLQAQLMELELAGLVGRLPGALFQRIASG